MSILNGFPAGAVPSKLPAFTYTGTYSLLDDGDGSWRIKALTSGTLTFTDKNWTLDLFLVGGGGAGGTYCGGGGGYTASRLGIAAMKNTGYAILIGAPGGSQGGTSSAFGYTAAGGFAGSATTGGNGGSGGGGAYTGAGGSDGSDGGYENSERYSWRGLGQQATTRAFGDADGELYAPGGGAWNGGEAFADGAGLHGPNSGKGGSHSGEAEAGIVILRFKKAA